MAKILVVGGGGRESALAWGLSKSSAVEQIYIVPGNTGTAQLAKSQNLNLNSDEIVNFAVKEKLELVVIGPEAPLVAGLSDNLRSKGVAVFGASAAAALLEASKAFATQFMQEEGILLPPSEIVKDMAGALAAIEKFGGPEKSVIKADGLAGGKGVFLPDSLEETEIALEMIFKGEVDGSGKQIVMQQRHHGPEVSIFVLSDGDNFQVIPISTQDHKRLLEGDEGPNTGGVGVYAPLPEWMLNSEQWAKITAIADKTIAGMKQRGTPYQGVLYLGLMLAVELNEDPLIIEYNVRFGDPETEVLIPLLVQNGVDIYELLNATATGSVKSLNLPSRIKGTALTICLCAEGYPENPKTGKEIFGLEKTYPDVEIFQAGTKQDGDKIVTSGGRVLYVTGFGTSLEDARNAATAAIGEQGIHFHNMYYRRDIGHRAIKQED